MTSEQRPSKPKVWRFRRYVNGRRMAEGIRITKADTQEQAFAKASQMAYSGDVLILVESPPDEPPAIPVAYRKFIESAYERHPRYIFREDTDIGAPDGWEPLYAAPPRASEPPAVALPEYTNAIGDAAAEYLRSVGAYGQPPFTSGNFYFHKLWDAMCRAAVTKPVCDCEGPQKIGPGYHAPYCATMAGTEFAKRYAPSGETKDGQ